MNWFVRNRISCGFVIAAMLLVGGCGPSREASPLTFQYAKVIYANASKRDASRMDDIALEIEEAVEKGEMTQREADRLITIIANAEAKEWEKATTAAEQLMNEQLPK